MLNVCKVTMQHNFKITNSDVTLVVGCHKILYSREGAGMHGPGRELKNLGEMNLGSGVVCMLNITYLRG